MSPSFDFEIWELIPVGPPHADIQALRTKVVPGSQVRFSLDKDCSMPSHDA